MTSPMPALRRIAQRGTGQREVWKSIWSMPHPEPGKDVPRKNCNVLGCGAIYVWSDSLRLHTKSKHPGMKHVMPLIYMSETLTIYL